ncbi:unnamed protein product [Symbiodinium natans]|uniref:Uncharacterized protein n=1 Tax=Symbiodinium natans TaxID=878477 RepID=A0A812RTE5_9DINO|nr:unnamed protein product [Symbiodinium natans]
MTLDRGMSGSRARRSLVASRARCATWKPPDTGTEEATALSAYLDENRDPPAALILTDDVRNIQEDLDPQSCSQPRCGAMPPWSRLDQRSPAPVPVSPVPPQTGEAPRNLHHTALQTLPSATDVSDVCGEESMEQNPQRIREVMMQVFAWMEDDHAGTTCGRSRKVAYKEGLNTWQRLCTKAVHQVHPGLSSQRRRGNAVPGAARDAVFAVLRELFPEHRFEQREVRVEVARPLQTDAEFRFPRLEASICGRGSPLSQCCDTTVLTFFDVVCGVCVICLKSTCAAPALQLSPLTESSRTKIWGAWISLNGGVLPKHRPPRPARTRFFPAPQDGWIPRAWKMALLAEEASQRKLHVDVELRQPNLTLDSDRSFDGSEPCEDSDGPVEAIDLEASQEVQGVEEAGNTATGMPCGDVAVFGASEQRSISRSISPQPALHRPDSWRARPVTDGQASLLKSKLEELYLEQRFGPLHLRAQEVLYECKQRKPDRDAVQSEELFHLTSEADDPAVLDAQAERRPATARSANTPTRSSPAMSRPSSSRPRSAGPGTLAGRSLHSLRSGENPGKVFVDAGVVTRTIFSSPGQQRLGQRWRVLPPKHVRPHHCDLPSVLVMAKPERIR